MAGAGFTNHFVGMVANEIAPDIFVAVESCDELQYYDHYFERSASIIINTAEKHVPLGHFVLLHVDIEEKAIHLFDSLTVAFADPNIVRYLGRIRKAHPTFRLYFSPFVIQSPVSSNLCGVYVLSYLANLTKRCKDLSMEEFYSQFSEINLSKNDEVCMRFLLNHIVSCLDK